MSTSLASVIKKLNSKETHTKPVTGLSLAREDAYETDCGISSEAKVRPARTSPPSLHGHKLESGFNRVNDVYFNADREDCDNKYGGAGRAPR